MSGENSTTRYVSNVLFSSEPLSSSDVVVYPPEFDRTESSINVVFLRCFSPFSTDVTLPTIGSLQNVFDSNACNWILRCRSAGGISTVLVSILQASDCGEINWAVCLTSFGRSFGFSAMQFEVNYSLSIQWTTTAVSYAHLLVSPYFKFSLFFWYPQLRVFHFNCKRQFIQ